MSNWRSIWQSNAGVNEGNANVSPPLPPWTLLCCWNGVARLMGLVMMNVAILLNGNRTLTKSCLLFVSLLNVKSSNQSSSSQNEINLTAHTVKMSNHDSYFHLKKNKNKSLVANPPFPSCSAQALQWSSCSLGSTKGLAAGPGLQAWLRCTTRPAQIQTRSACDAHLLTFMPPFMLLIFTSSFSCSSQSGYKMLGRVSACAAQGSQWWASTPPHRALEFTWPHGPHASVSSIAPFLLIPLLMLSPASLQHRSTPPCSGCPTSCSLWSSHNPALLPLPSPATPFVWHFWRCG